DTGRNARPVIDTRSVTDDVFEERAVDGGLWRPRVPHRRERGEDDGEDAAIGFAVPLQEEGLGGSDELILLLGGERRRRLKTMRSLGSAAHTSTSSLNFDIASRSSGPASDSGCGCGGGGVTTAVTGAG